MIVTKVYHQFDENAIYINMSRDHWFVIYNKGRAIKDTKDGGIINRVIQEKVLI